VPPCSGCLSRIGDSWNLIIITRICGDFSYSAARTVSRTYRSTGFDSAQLYCRASPEYDWQSDIPWRWHYDESQYIIFTNRRTRNIITSTLVVVYRTIPDAFTVGDFTDIMYYLSTCWLHSVVCLSLSLSLFCFFCTWCKIRIINKINNIMSSLKSHSVNHVHSRDVWSRIRLSGRSVRNVNVNVNSHLYCALYSTSNDRWRIT